MATQSEIKSEIHDQKSTVAKPLAAYSPTRLVRTTADNSLLYLSGTTARKPDGQIPPFGHTFDPCVLRSSANPFPVAIQTEVILSKFAHLIYDASGGSAGLEAIVEITIFVVDLKRDYAAMNEVFNRMVGERFKGKEEDLPARTCVQVVAMPPDERTLVEMKAVALLQRLPKGLLA